MAKSFSASDEPAEQAPVKKVRERLNRNKIPVEKGSKVFDISDPTRFGTVSAKGVEVSEVTWEDGIRRFVSNNYLRGI